MPASPVIRQLKPSFLPQSYQPLTGRFDCQFSLHPYHINQNIYVDRCSLSIGVTYIACLRAWNMFQTRDSRPCRTSAEVVMIIRSIVHVIVPIVMCQGGMLRYVKPTRALTPLMSARKVVKRLDSINEIAPYSCSLQGAFRRQRKLFHRGTKLT